MEKCNYIIILKIKGKKKLCPLSLWVIAWRNGKITLGIEPGYFDPGIG